MGRRRVSRSRHVKKPQKDIPLGNLFLKNTTFVELLDISIPQYDKDHARLDFIRWVKHLEKLVCQTIEAIMGTNKQIILESFMKHLLQHGKVCLQLKEVLIQNFEGMRRLRNFDANSGTSMAILVGGTWLKYTYLIHVAQAMQATIVHTNSRTLKRKCGFQLPFLFKEKLSLDNVIQDQFPLEDDGDGDAFSSDSSVNTSTGSGNSLVVPNVFRSKPGDAYPNLLLVGALLFPWQKLGTYTQWQLYQQTQHLATVWNELSNVNEELLKFLGGITAVLAESECMSYSRYDPHLDMGPNYSSYTLMNGIDELSIKGNQRLVISEDRVYMEDSDKAKELKRSLRLESYTLCTAPRYTSEMLGMMVPMITQSQILYRLLCSPIAIKKDEASQSYAMKTMGVFIRYLDKPHDLEYDSDGNCCIPYLFTARTSPSIYDLMQEYNNLWIELFKKESNTAVENSTLESIARECRLIALPFGIAERYSYTHEYDWPQNIDDTEDDCVAREVLNHQLHNWIFRKFGDYTYDTNPVDQAFFYANLINSLCYSYTQDALAKQAQQDSKSTMSIEVDIVEWSKRAFYFAKHESSIDIEETIQQRQLPFIMFLLGEMLFVHRQRAIKVNSLIHAIAMWFVYVDIEHDSNTCDSLGKIYHIPYVAPFLQHILSTMLTSTVMQYQQIIEAHFGDSEDANSSSEFSDADSAGSWESGSEVD